MNTRVAPETSQETEEQQKEEPKTEQPGLAEKITSQIKELSQKISDTWESSSPQHKRIFLIVVVFLLALIIIVPTAVVVSSKSQKSGTGNKTSNDSLPISGKQTGNQDSFKLCNPNPCENNGICVSGNNDYACKCQDGYYGNKCNITNTLCNSNPCENNGVCLSGKDDYACNCQKGYYGSKCDQKNNLCDSNPCENGGTCVSGKNDYACKCKGGYYGKNCEKLNNLCDSNPCGNRGTCVSEKGDYACKCHHGYYASNCEIKAIDSICDPNPCKNNGTCVNGKTDYACKCQHGYAGINCEKSIYPITDPGWYTPGNGYQYRVASSVDTWQNIRVACQDMGGDLAGQGMKDLSTRRHLASVLQFKPHMWIGLNDIASEGNFVWIDGSASTRSNTHWISGKPDDFDNNEDCGELQEEHNYLTNDVICSANYHGLCEKRLN